MGRRGEHSRGIPIKQPLDSYKKNQFSALKMDVKVTKDQICDSPVPKKKYPIMYQTTKFHTLIIKSTIPS